MGHRQPRYQVVAAAAWLLALTLTGCGATAKSAPTSEEPTSEEPSRTEEQDAGIELEALQIQAIANALNEFGPAVHTCWARAAADDFRLDGQVALTVDFVEPGQGRAQVASDGVDDAVLTDCLVALWNDYQWPSFFAPGDRIELPPFEFVAPDAQYTVASSHVAVHELAGGKVRARVLLDEDNTGNSQAALSLLALSDAVRVPLHTHSSAELLFVLSGKAVVEGIGASQKVAPGSAIYIPAGTVHGLQHTGEAAMQLLQLYAPGGPEARFKDASGKNANQAQGTTAFRGKLPKRGARAQVRDVGAVAPIKILSGMAEVRILFDEAQSADKAAYLGVLSAEPGATVPLHRHSESSEYLFVIEGQAEMKIGNRVIPVHPGDGIQIPPGVEHGVSFSGASRFKAIQFYSPAGPEQRFKGGSK